MNKIVVLYQSKYGATQRYAHWLAEELACDLVETKKASIEQIKAYDVIILGGGVYASEILGFSFLKKYFKLCGMLKKMVTKKDPATYESWEAALMEASGPCDWTDKEALNPIIAAVRT